MIKKRRKISWKLQNYENILKKIILENENETNSTKFFKIKMLKISVIFK